ncbi:hypothetical protein Tco_0866169 [Tanacetum coccineum]
MKFRDMESSPVEGSSSQGLGQNSTASPFAATRTPNDNPTLEDNEINRTTNNSGTVEEEEEESSHFEIKKRKMTSKVWNEFTKHLKSCTPRAIFQKQQQRITLQVVDPDSMSQVVTPALVDGTELVDQAWEKHSHDYFRTPTAHDMEILIKTCLMPLAIKTQNDSFTFVHELKQEMHDDLKYVESFEKEIDELESDKAEFSNMYDILLQEIFLSWYGYGVSDLLDRAYRTYWVRHIELLGYGVLGSLGMAYWLFGYGELAENVFLMVFDQSIIYGVSADVDTAYSSKSSNGLLIRQSLGYVI